MSTQRGVTGYGGNCFVCRVDIASAPRKRARRQFPGVCSGQIIIENVIRSLSDNGKKRTLNTTRVNLIFCVCRVDGTCRREMINSIYNREIFKKLYILNVLLSICLMLSSTIFVVPQFCANRLGDQRNEIKKRTY